MPRSHVGWFLVSLFYLHEVCGPKASDEIDEGAHRILYCSDYLIGYLFSPAIPHSSTKSSPVRYKNNKCTIAIWY